MATDKSYIPPLPIRTPMVDANGFITQPWSSFFNPTLFKVVNDSANYTAAPLIRSIANFDSSPGIIVQVSEGVAAKRALSTNTLTIANATGANGDPSINLSPITGLVPASYGSKSKSFVGACDAYGRLQAAAEVDIEHNTLVDLQGGITNEYYHLSSARASQVALLNGSTGAILSWTTSGTLGTAAYTNATAYEAAGSIATHAALRTGVHGINITAGKTLSATGSITIGGTDGSTLNVGTGGTLGTAAYIADNTLVHLAGTETITGIKTFSETIKPSKAGGQVRLVIDATVGNDWGIYNSSNDLYLSNWSPSATNKLIFANTLEVTSASSASCIVNGGLSVVKGLRVGNGITSLVRSTFQAPSDAAIVVKRTGTATGQVAFEAVGNRDGANTFDVFRVYNGAFSKHINFYMLDTGDPTFKSSTGGLLFEDTREATSHTVASVAFSGGIGVAKRIVSPKMVITEDGGFAIRVVAGEALSRGEIVYIKVASGADGKVWKNPVDGDMPIGVVFANASADAEVLVVTTGIAYVLPEAGITATRGYIIYSSSSTAGRVAQAASTPAAITHFNECGHFLDTGSGNGALTRAVIHFN